MRSHTQAFAESESAKIILYSHLKLENYQLKRINIFMQYSSYIFPFLFRGMWVSATFIISKMGWSDLASKYQTNAVFTGDKAGLISASINNANYKNSLILKYNEEGLYLKPIFLFSLFHKPILIPWEEIKEVRDKKIFFYDLKELIVGIP